MWTSKDIMMVVAVVLLLFMVVRQNNQIKALSRTTHNAETIEFTDYAGRKHCYRINREVHG